MSTRYQITMTRSDNIRSLINRLARLDAAEIWESPLNPAQIGALEYLARANRFSRSPSHVADYLGTTRGTMSQTLKSLARRGFVEERRSETDKRSISYELTGAGRPFASRGRDLIEAIEALPETERAGLDAALSDLLAFQLRRGGMRQFGVCRACTHHRVTQDGPFCALLALKLLPEEVDQICHEQEAA